MLIPPPPKYPDYKAGDTGCEEFFGQPANNEGGVAGKKRRKNGWTQRGEEGAGPDEKTWDLHSKAEM